MRKSYYRTAIKEFVRDVEAAAGRDIKSVILYGSAAYGGYKSGESDIDVLIVSKNRRIYDKILDIQTELNSKYGVAFSILFDTPKEVEKELKIGSSFMNEIWSRGVLLYGSR